MENIVEIKYDQTAQSSNTNELGMREMQAKVYKAKDEQYLLVKAPPADKQQKIEALAEKLLFTNETHIEKMLVEMYDHEKMPADLRAAHHALGMAIDSCYQSAPCLRRRTLGMLV